jgi:hypothetical protein
MLSVKNFEKMYENGTIKPKYFNMIVYEENVKLGSDLTNSEISNTKFFAYLVEFLLDT